MMAFTNLIYWNITGELKQTKKPNLTERETNNIKQFLRVIQ